MKNRAILLGEDLASKLNSELIDDNVPKITSSTSESVWHLIGLVLLLIVILIAAYYTTKFVANAKFGQLRTSNFKLIDSYRIAPNKMLQIVKVANKYLVLAVSKDSVEFITELEEAEVMVRDTRSIEKQSFKKILEKIKEKNGSE
ncbi:MAG: flagellar biosynthetic protein FliO [Clostridiales bacterium]|jgi:flagellar protein FliO/FliZ|nr:flagellar biosynthetic protein FliO [Clostridiales bacterium]